MKSNQILFAIASLMITASAQAQVDGASNGVAPSSRTTSFSARQTNDVDRFLDAERKKNEAAYKNLFPRTDGVSPVIVVDLETVAGRNVNEKLANFQRSMEKRFSDTSEIPDQFAIAIQNSAQVHHDNKIVEIIMKEAEKHKKKLEAKARIESQKNANGSLAAGSSGVIENAGGSNNLDGKWSIKGGLGENKKIMLVWKKRTMTW